MTDVKFLNQTQLIVVLGEHLPRNPSAHRIKKALKLGMPFVVDAASGLRMYDPEAVLEWWIRPSDRKAS
jgi:hypothetical protein